MILFSFIYYIAGPLIFSISCFGVVKRNCNDKNNLSNHTFQHNFESITDILTKKNRCQQYPRCLLFSCCNDTYVKYIDSFHDDIICNSNYFPCILSGYSNKNCIYNQSLSYRLQQLDIMNMTFSLDLINKNIINLPPTHPSLFQKIENNNEFNILYLVQGDYRSKLEECYKQIKDLIYLSYKEKLPGQIYYPSAKFFHGRMALYLVARLLEIKQGWLYNYYVFMDDDADFAKGNLNNYENFLKTWLPAIGVPGYSSRYPHKDQVESISHFDFIVTGYHREVVEILHPWILDYDEKCIWASEFYQNQEATLIYRNHILSFKDLIIWNAKHRHRAARICREILLKVVDDVSSSTPKALEHCFIRELELYKQGAITGIPRKKKENNISYHLYFHKRNKNKISNKYKNNNNNNIYYYSNLNQSFTCPNITEWSQKSENCCSIDLLYL